MLILLWGSRAFNAGGDELQCINLGYGNWAEFDKVALNVFV